MKFFVHRIILLCLFLFSLSGLRSQNTIQRIEPPNWWAGMKNHNIQLMVYGKNISDWKVSIPDENIKLTAVHKAKSPNYLFIDLNLSENIEPGDYEIHFSRSDKEEIYNYPIEKRAKFSSERKGFTPTDIIYLVMPDRFANGDTTNDQIANMYEKADRNNPDGRHGGDFQGIIDHLQYIKGLGVSFLWLNPIQENNQKVLSYHGYAITDFYNTDARLGSKSLYKQLVQDCHDRGLKVMIDLIYNHCGLNHWWMDDLPFENWIHKFPAYTQSNFHASVVNDPYVSKTDFDRMQNGWFHPTMPDLNQKNIFLANYLIQNSIWWVEYAGIDAIRIDTYAYSDQEFMSNLCKKIREEYPDISLLGEIWVGEPGIVSYWKQKGQDPGLSSIFDFPFHDAVKKALNEEGGWTSGMARIYNLLTQDFLYETPENNVIFCDNHDVNRIYESLGKDLEKMKLAFTLLLTTRGVPLIYYGTELLYPGSDKDGHGDIRRDFPGGWPEDQKNWFESKDCSKDQLEFNSFIRFLINYRNEMPALQTGKLVHFIPENDVYVYCRYNDDSRILIVLNNSNKDQTLNLNKYSECFRESGRTFDVLNEKEHKITENVKLAPKSVHLFEML